MRSKTALVLLIIGMLLILAFLAFTALAGDTGTTAATESPAATTTAAAPTTSPEAAPAGTLGIKLGQALYAAHSTTAFCVATVAMTDDRIAAAWLDEFQYVDPATFTNPVPNTDAFKNADGYVLASKRMNNDAYSALMKEKGSATQPLATSYQAIEAYVAGKTVADLENAVAGKTAPQMVDAVSGSTLQDTLGYVQALIQAAKAVK